MYSLCYEQVQHLAGRKEVFDIPLADFPTREEAEAARLSMDKPNEYYIKMA